MKLWRVIDPYIASSTTDIVESFATKEEADRWLAEMTRQDDAGFCGCYVEKR